MDFESQKNAAIITPIGIYKQLRCCYGLAQLPAVYSQILSKIIEIKDNNKKNILIDSLNRNVLIYLDDIFLAHKDNWDHLRALELIIRRGLAMGITFSGGKCKFGRKKLELLGLVVSDETIEAPENKVISMQECVNPNTGKTGKQKITLLQTFLGKAQWLSRFSSHQANITRPLQMLLQKDGWNWTELQEECVKKVKKTYWGKNKMSSS